MGAGYWLNRVWYGLIGAVLGAGYIGYLVLCLSDMQDLNEFIIVLYSGCSVVAGAIAGIVTSQYIWKKRQSISSSRSRFVWLASWAFGPLLLVPLEYWTSGFPERAPSDSVMIANFKSHQSDFECMAAMVGHDPKLQLIEIVTPRSKESTATGVDGKRAQQYAGLLRKMDCFGVSRDSPSAISFEYWQFGQGHFVSAGAMEKDYVLETTAPKPIVSDLSKVDPNSNKYYDAEGYRHIEGNWYLYYRDVE